jgi:hypothetical protein
MAAMAQRCCYIRSGVWHPGQNARLMAAVLASRNRTLGYQGAW